MGRTIVEILRPRYAKRSRKDDDMRGLAIILLIDALACGVRLVMYLWSTRRAARIHSPYRVPGST